MRILRGCSGEITEKLQHRPEDMLQARKKIQWKVSYNDYRKRNTK